ncbi:MAG: thermonuclease family protein [Planctomycetota bacterium]
MGVTDGATVTVLHDRAEVRMRLLGIDRFKRVLATLKIEGRSINHAMVRAGMAWHYTQFSDNAELAAAEQEAREARRGLRRDADPVPP